MEVLMRVPHRAEPSRGMVSRIKPAPSQILAGHGPSQAGPSRARPGRAGPGWARLAPGLRRERPIRDRLPRFDTAIDHGDELVKGSGVRKVVGHQQGRRAALVRET